MAALTSLPIPNKWRATITRGMAVKDPSGTVKGVDDPIMGLPQYFCNPPATEVIEKVYTSNGNVRLADIGVDYNSQREIAAVLNDANQQIEIFVGGSSTTPYIIPYANQAGKGNAADILVNFTDNNVNEAWTPRSLLIVNGLILVLCEVRSTTLNGGGNWWPTAIGLLSIELKNLELTGTAGSKLGWGKREFRSNVLPGLSGQSNGALLNQFVLQRPCVLDGKLAPTTFYLTFTEYNGDPHKDGGTAMVCRCTRTSETSNDWTVGQTIRVYEYNAGTLNTTHVHGWRLVPNSDGTASGLIVRGDTVGTQGLVYVECSAPDTLDNNAAAISTGYRYLAADASRWTTAVTVNGIASTKPGSQPVGEGFCYANAGTIFGADEEMLELYQALAPRSQLQSMVPLRKAIPQLSTGHEGADFNYQRHRVAFHLKSSTLAATAGTKYTIVSQPSTTDPNRVHQGYVLFSPDCGQNWVPCWHSPENEQTVFMPSPLTGRIHCGSQGLNLQRGWRSIAPPVTKLVRPLRIRGLGSTNYMPGTSTSSTSNCTATKVTVATLAARGVSDPITEGEIWEVDAPATVGTAFFTLAAATGFPKANRFATVRFKMRPKRPIAAEMSTPDSFAHNFTVKVFCANNSDTSNGHYSGNTQSVHVSAHEGWYLFTILLDVQSFSNPDGYKSSGDTTLKFNLIITPGGYNNWKQSYYVAMDGFYNGHEHPHPCAGGSGAFPDYITVLPETPLAMYDATQKKHQIYVAGFIPEDGWDQLHPTPSTRTATRVSDTQSTINIGTGLTAGMATLNFFAGAYFFPQVSGTWGQLPLGRKITASSYNSGTGLVTLTHETYASPASFLMMIHTVTRKERHLITVKHSVSNTGYSVFWDTQDHQIICRKYTGGAYGTTEDIDQITISKTLGSGGDYLWPTTGAPFVLVMNFTPESAANNADGNLFIAFSVNGRLMASNNLFALTADGIANYTFDVIQNNPFGGVPDAVDLVAIGYDNKEIDDLSAVYDLSFINAVDGQPTSAPARPVQLGSRPTRPGVVRKKISVQRRRA